ncbi:MAG: GNAT family N-acetyltransferase [Bdellovibrionaceae bacterium]|nr:GNAT family N-acetyltransferase [Pseudobdellovibrionaceae bacterium]
MEGPRAPREAELPDLLKFLDKALRPDQQWSIQNEYPTALGKQNINNIRIITENDRFLSHAVMKPLIIKTPLMIYKAAAIGSVVTDQDHRGQGLSSQILDSCLVEAQAQDCDFAILWTNLYDFYRKIGFELAGFEESVVFEKEFAVPAHDLIFKTGSQVSSEAILRLYTKHAVGTARNAEEVRKFLQIPKSQVHTAWDKSGQLVAYAVEGKGADLTDYVHEWGGSVSALLALMSHLRKTKARPFTMILPNHSVNLLVQLQKLPVTINQGYLGMIKILKPEAFFAKIQKAARTLGISDLTLETVGDGSFRVGFAGDLRTLPSERDLVRFIFGPGDDLGFLPSSAQKSERIFPLPLWFWGWDSI